MFKKYLPYYRSNIKLAYPVVISQLGHTLVALSDSLIVGHKSSVALAAVSLGNAVFTVIMMIGIGISYGLTPLIAQENGRKNHDEIGKLLKNSLIINVFTGFLLCALTLLASHFLPLLGEPPEVVSLARPFMNFLGFSVIPLMLFLTFKQFAEGLGFTKQAMRISIIGNLINICLGITLVFGLFGFRSYGVLGVGISTLTDRSLMGITMCLYVLKADRFKLYLQKFKKAGLSMIRMKNILRIGIPVSLQYLFEVSAFTSAAIMVGWMGTNQLAAHQIALSLAAITYMMASGLSAAATIQTGHSYGKLDYAHLRIFGISSYHLVFVFMGITGIMFISLNRILPQLYIQDQNVINFAAPLLIIAGLFQLFDGFQVVGLGILRGMSDVKVPTLITFIAYWIIGLPLGYLLGIRNHMGPNGVWIGLLVGLAMAAGMLFIRFQWKSRQHLVSLSPLLHSLTKNEIQ